MKGIERVRMMVFACVLGAFLLMACKGEERPMNSMYYWSTTLRMDSAKLAFIENHHVGRLYVRYFDVVVDDKGEVMPNATVKAPLLSPQGGEDSTPHSLVSPQNEILNKMEVVPTIFIVNDVMRKDTEGLAERILKRVMQMNETHGIKNVHEIQIDCDWSVKTRQRFFSFMEELHSLTKKHGLRLTSTIRLHQLAQRPPSCDKGVLMMYNTGDFTKFSEEHPILDMQVASRYLRYLKDYPLPLATAYPIFGWDVVFREGDKSGTFIFVGLLHFEGELPVMPGDTIVRREPTVQEIMQAREAIGKIRPDANSEVILFDLSNSNISRFKTKEYEEIFGH